MIIIFDCIVGLCNQFHDIEHGISFCIDNNIQFSFRCASFRNNNLISWYDVKFDKLFDTAFLNKYNLYINFNELQSKINNSNSLGYEKQIYLSSFVNDFQNKTDFILYLKNTNKNYIILRQPWCLNKFKFNRLNMYCDIYPSKNIYDKYILIKKELFPNNEKYNFIHYRYEHDFIKFFKINNMPSLFDVIKNIKFTTKLNIYIASTNINKLLENEDLSKLDVKLLYKNENNFLNLNFEEKGFIDYMFGLECDEIYGHSSSSFSIMLNNLKKTNNYYDKI